MDLIKMTRELGKELQKDERFKTLLDARKANDADDALNEIMGKLQLVRLSYNNEYGKEDKNEQKLAAYEEEFNTLFDKAMQNTNMIAFEAAREEMDKLMKEITGILSMCAIGEDPDTCQPEHECGGECSSCHGDCH